MVRVGVMLAGFLLSACGGGSDLSNLDRDFELSGNSTSETLAEFEDGSAALALKAVVQSNATIDEPSYMFVVTSNPDDFTNTISSTLNIDESDRDDYGGTDYYRIQYEGTNYEGKLVQAVTKGYFLDGDEHQVSTSVLFIDFENSDNPTFGLLSSGTEVQGLPSGRHTYSGGDAMIAYGDSGIEEMYDNMTISVNFDKLKGSLLAQTENLFISATDFKIQASNGTFMGDNALIGVAGTDDTAEANVAGGFSGVSADGIHGIVYSKTGNFSADSCDACGVGTFYAIKDR